MLHLADKEQKILWTNIPERKGHSEKLGSINFQIKFPPPAVMQMRRFYLWSEKDEIGEEQWNASEGGEGHVLSLLQLSWGSWLTDKPESCLLSLLSHIHETSATVSARAVFI